jgi:hypothetical protein
MPWFWGGRDNDPAKSLDKDLKKFLDDQSTRPYAPAQPLPVKAPEVLKDVESRTSPVPDAQQSFEEKPLPKESLFQDGRYKHLWKSYVPQSTVTAASGNPIDLVMNARKDRRTSIHRAALENCAFEEDLRRQCLGSGMASSVKSRMTMCSAETKTFNRCYQLQAKFLQALGYMGNPTSSDEFEERVQMHADKLYHRMMDYEEAVEDARLNGKPIPPLSSVFNPDQPAPIVEQANLPESVQRRLKVPLKDLPPHERELTIRAATTEATVANDDAEDFFKYTTTMNEARQKRQAMAVKVLGEPIGKFLIPDPPQAPGTKRPPNELVRDSWTSDGSPRDLSNRIEKG